MAHHGQPQQAAAGRSTHAGEWVRKVVVLCCQTGCAGTKSAVKLGSGLDPIRVGTKFETQRDMLGLKLPMQ